MSAYYRIKPDLKTYGWFEFDYQKMLKILGRKTYSGFTQRDDSLAEHWADFEGRFEAPDGEFAPLATPDISTWSAGPHLLLSPKAYKVRQETLALWGEFLNAPSNGIHYRVFNCRTTRPADPIISKATMEDGLQVGLESLNFKPSEITGAPLFKTDFDYHVSLYRDERFKDLMESQGLKGLTFRTDLATSPLL